MKSLRDWPWPWAHGKAAARRRSPQCVQLNVETLEDRLAPSATNTAMTLQQWSQQTFTIDDQVVASGAAAQTAAVSQSALPTNASYGSMIGLTSAFSSTSYRGQGYSVAVIDTGIDYDDPTLGGGFGPGYKVIAGYDFVNDTADPMDDNGHGTFVANEIAGSSATYSGIAPDVNLIALKVLDASGSGTYGNVLAALDWVIANRTKYNIVAINMSLGSGNYTVNPYTFLDSDLSALKADGVFTAVAAGNSYYTYDSQPGLDYPAIDPYVVSVGAVYDGNFGSVTWASGAIDYTTAQDVIASFSQRSASLSMLAPGAIVTNYGLDNTLEQMAGTSMATPVITGAAVLLHEAMDAMHETANQTTILSDMQATGVTVVDGSNESNNVVHTGLSFKRINLSAALNAIGQPSTPTPPSAPSAPIASPVLQPIANQTVAPGGSLTITLSGSDPNGLTLSYSASTPGTASSQAYQLRQQLGLTYAGSYYTDIWGDEEKWMSSTSGTWYCILPNGQLRRWTGSMTTTLQAANLVATLSTSYYADPSQLWNAQPAPAGPTLTVSGNKLTIQAPASATGSYQIQVTASDGKASASQSFTLAIQHSVAPQITSIATQSMLNDRSQSLTLGVQGTSGSAITYSANIVGTNSILPASLVLSGNQLTIYSSPAFVGSFSIQVTATSGGLSSSTTFQVNVASSNAAYVLKGDFNGDGIQDTLFFNQNGSIWVSLANANGTFVNQNWGQWSAASNWKLIQVGNFNGDGKTDVIGFSTSGGWYVGTSTGTAFNTTLWSQWSAASNWNTVQVGDFNGDGKTDVIGFSNTGSWLVGISTGTAFNTSLWTQWSAASQWSNIEFLDVDGNGKLDVAGYDSQLKTWYVGYSTGTNFLVQAWTSSTPPTSHASSASASGELFETSETASSSNSLTNLIDNVASLTSTSPNRVVSLI